MHMRADVPAGGRALHSALNTMPALEISISGGLPVSGRPRKNGVNGVKWGKVGGGGMGEKREEMGHCYKNITENV